VTRRFVVRLVGVVDIEPPGLQVEVVPELADPIPGNPGRFDYGEYRVLDPETGRELPLLLNADALKELDEKVKDD